jgi:glycosyltransferase involved in cell wall biosynthesis
VSRSVPSRLDDLPSVCLVAPSAWPVLSGDRSIRVIGGAEVQQSMLARAFAAAGHPTTMVCLDFGQPEGVRIDGVTVLKAYRPDEGLPGLRFLHPRLTAIWRAMKRADADIYYFRTSSVYTGFGAVFTRLHGRRSVYAAASDADFMPGLEFIQYERDRRIFRYGLRHVDAIVAQNPGQVRDCLQHYGREPVFVPSCYKVPAGSRADPGGPVAWVATVRPNKRPEMFLEVARRLPHRRFLMVGGAGGGDRESIGYYESVEREARALPNVEFAGFVPLADVEALYDRASLLVNTSVTEGFPNTFLHAWARGIPTLGTLDTGSRHQGLPVYTIARDAQAMASEVEALLGSPECWLETSRRCRSHFDHTHSVGAVAARYGDLFRALAASGVPAVKARSAA